MRRLLTPKPSADISTSTPPAGLVEDLAFRRDSRVLVATSSAIALSLGSALHDTSKTSSDGATVRGKDTGWETAYGAARMAMEIAKESSDMFPPLKAVVGAMSILIRNYDVSVSCSRTEQPLIFSLQQTSDNAEGMKEIEGRVQSLSGVLASPADENDYAEKARRVELRRYVSLQMYISLLIPLSGSLRWSS